MDREQIKERLIGILQSSELGARAGDLSELTEDTSLLDELIVDSLQLLEFIVAMENAFGFKVTSDHLSIDMFDHFGRVIDFVQSNLSATCDVAAGGSHGP
jgi:acyl carrier protein